MYRNGVTNPTSALRVVVRFAQLGFNICKGRCKLGLSGDRPIIAAEKNSISGESMQVPRQPTAISGLSELG